MAHSKSWRKIPNNFLFMIADGKNYVSLLWNYYQLCNKMKTSKSFSISSELHSEETSQHPYPKHSPALYRKLLHWPLLTNKCHFDALWVYDSGLPDPLNMSVWKFFLSTGLTWKNSPGVGERITIVLKKFVNGSILRSFTHSIKLNFFCKS